MKFRFPVIIIDEDLRSENISESGIHALVQAIEQEGMKVIGLTSYGDLTSFAQQSSRALTFIVSTDNDEFINPDNGKPELEAVENLHAFVTEVRRRNADIPIFLHGETRTSHRLSNDVLRELHGFTHMFEDTPELVARHIIREAHNYLDSLSPPFSKVLIDYAQDSSYSWHYPGHSGGVAFLKSPTGQVLHQLFGENVLRANVCNAVGELGQLPDHTGPVAASERNAAHIFGSNHTLFVTNGTPTSNKMVWHADMAFDDIVVMDRNCHKSNLHAVMMMGVIPVFLMPTRSHFGIIGSISENELESETIARKIVDHPLASKVRNKKPRILIITQGTYDGALYNAEMIENMLSIETDILHSDKAWLPHASFHPFYENMHAIDHGRPRSKDALVYAAQSTHKLLAGLSQASQILAQDLETRKLDMYRFNGAYLVHTSTSPQYSITVLCDVAAAMMEASGGIVLVGESIVEALGFCRVMRKVEHEHLDTNGGNGRGDDWWFKVWGPSDLPDEGIKKHEVWILKANERWYGFGNLAEDFNLFDSTKVTIITPGLNVDSKFSDSGISAAIVTRYLAEHGIIIEKMGLYSFFIMFTIDIIKGRWNSLMTELQQLKDDYDNNQLLWRVLSEFVCQCSQYKRIGLRELCDSIHSVYQANDATRVTTGMHLSDMEPVIIPSDAWVKMAHRETERIATNDLEGCVTGILLTSYPSGIPLLIPGECFNKAIVQHLQFVRESNKLLPGSETDIHELVEEEIDDGMEYLVDCIR